jgi:RecG-like helicase
MDRLICGDVGYGKTEVALRAAFKAAPDGKQVLMLVPTTILAQQHFGTFAERCATTRSRRACLALPLPGRAEARRSRDFARARSTS